MRVEMVEIGVEMRRILIVLIRKCYGFVSNHPFLAGLLLFLFYMYRTFPFLFSILVSSSPVLVCTAFLLGFLLSLGDPNIPEIEKEESVSHEIVSLRTEVRRDTTVVERESFVVERYSGFTSRDEVENLIDETRNDSVGCVDGGLVNTGPLIEDYFESERELHDPDMSQRKNDETVFLENQYSRIEEMDEESVGLLNVNSPMRSIGSVVAEPGDSPPSSPWKQFGDNDDDMADGYSDSSTDRAESSSPDASMADIIPLLDEFQPFLHEEETPLVAHGSEHGSDHSSHRSQGYKELPNDSGEESEAHDDDEDEKDETKEDESKPEITWTEDDQKNLMDLGTLELERNQRLESLIARRRARKLMVEKNLIDLNYDLPFNVPPISTTRKNPFDLPDDSNENTGLPPIPGSAPSVMSRRNPFDLPYDSSEEKPDLTTDSFQQEFSPLPSRATMFRRHESFNVGPSIFAPPKFDRDDFRFRPYFVPEGSSDSSFRRQTSELSDISKISSVLESESICSIGEDDKNIGEEDILGDVEIPNQDDNKILEDYILGDIEIPNQDLHKIIEEDLLGDVEMGSDLEDPSLLVGHGSESSEDEDDVVELNRPEVREVEEREIEHREVEMRSATLVRALSTIEEVHYSSRSSSSSSSEEHERAFDGEKHEVLTSLELDMDKVNEQVDELKEPVYDLSPSSVNKNQSCSSISSDLLVDQTSEMDKTVVSFSYRQIDFCNENIEMDANESSSSEILVTVEQVLDHGLSENYEKLEDCEDDQVSSLSLRLDDHNVETFVKNDIVEEHSISEAIVFQRNQDGIHSSSSNAYSKWVSVEKPMDELHSFDKPVADLSANVHKELLEPPTMQLESIAENHYEGSTLSEDPNLDQVTVQTRDFQSEASSYHVQEPDFTEEGEEIQDIDERLLMELDNVGDFSIGELGSSLSGMPLVEARSVEEIDSIILRTEPVPMKNEAEMSSRMMLLEDEEVKSGVNETLIEEVEADSNQITAETENQTISEPMNYDDINSRMHGLEATSVQDIDTAFKQKRDDENAVIVDSLESLPANVEAEVAEISEENENKTVFEVDSGRHELEGTSFPDIETAVEEVIDDEKPLPVDPLESLQENIEAEAADIGEETVNKFVFEPVLHGEIDSGMHELGATSIQDIVTDFEQVIDDENPAIVDSLNAESLPEKYEAEAAEISEETENITVFNIDSETHELEATSIQEIDTGFEQTIHNDALPMSVDPLESLSENIEAEVAEIGEETESKSVSKPTHDDKIDSGMHELQATSIQDIAAAFRQINDNEIENPVIFDSLNAESLPENIEAEVAETGEETEIKSVSKLTHDDEIDSGMHELQATSIQDITAAIRQINYKEIENPAMFDSLEAESLPENIEAQVAEFGGSEINTLSGLDSGSNELEAATSIQDSYTTSTQTRDVENSVIVDSLNGELLPEMIEAEIGEENESKTVHKIDSGHELVATSIQDIDTDFREINQEKNEKPVIVYSLDAKSLPENVEAGVAKIGEQFENKTVIEPIFYDEGSAVSVDNINRSFRQVNEEDTEKPVPVESMDAESLPKVIEAEVSEIEAPEAPSLEANSIEDIDLDLKQHHAIERYSSSFSEFFEYLEAEDKAEFFEANFDDASSQNNEVENSAVLEPIQEEEINSGMEQLEAQSLEDIYSAFRHIKDELENPVDESLEPVSLPGKNEAGASEIETPESSVFEARSSEDIEHGSVLENDESVTIEADDQADEISSTTVEFDSKSIEDNDTNVNQIKEVETLDEERDSWMKEVEAQSLEDFKSAFRQINEEAFETSVMVTSLAGDLGPEKIEELERPELPVDEARSVEDTGLSLQQIHEIEEHSNFLLESEKSDIIKTEEMLERDAQSIKYIDAASSSVEEVETIDEHPKARSLENIHSTSKPIKEEEVENPVVVPLIADLVPEEREAGVSEIGRLHSDPSEKKTREMAVVDAKSIEDVGLAMKQVHENEENNHPTMETEEQEEEVDAQSIGNIDAQYFEDNDGAFSFKEYEKPTETAVLGSKDFEAQSTENINLTFRHIKNEEVVEPVSVASLMANLATDKSEAGIFESETDESPVTEARSIEDTSFDQINKVDTEEITLGMKKQAQSLEDIESALKLFKVENIEKPMVIESPKGELLPEKDEADISETGLTLNEPNVEETIVMGLPVVEARSVERLSNEKPSIETEDALKPNFTLQVKSENEPNSLSEETEKSIADPVKAQISGNFSKEVQSNVDVSSLLVTNNGAKENEPNIEVSSAALESDDRNLSFSDGIDKKKGNSHKSKSDSSSSSSSSDSD